MQTLRKLPKTAPNSRPTTRQAVNQRTHDLMKKDSRRDRHVERLGAGGERDRHPTIAPRADSAAPTPAPSLPRPRRHRSASARAGALGPERLAVRRGDPDLGPRAPAPTRETPPASAATAGSRNSAPMLPRSTLGLVSSAVPLSATTPAAPSPSAVRRMVPTFPGSCTASSTRTGRARARPRCPPGASAAARSPRRRPAAAPCRPGRRARHRSPPPSASPRARERS